nr:unnamed protein product [Callosobruchus analis]
MEDLAVPDPSHVISSPSRVMPDDAIVTPENMQSFSSSSTITVSETENRTTPLAFEEKTSNTSGKSAPQSKRR